MKAILHSVVDVITNSSSEVYIMSASDANYYNKLEGTCGCVGIQEIESIEWIRTNHYEYGELICDYLNLNFLFFDDRYYYLETFEELWNQFIDENLDKFNKAVGKYIVDIEDHFEDAGDVLHEARGDAYAYTSRR